MFNEIMDFYNKALNTFKGVLDENLLKLFMSDGWNEFTKILANYSFDFKEANDKNMEKMLNLFRVSSKSDMDEIGEDIADLRKTIVSLKEQIKELTDVKSKK
jgi:polyhydroxyalkanoate synthesis regulator phasin